MVAQRLSKICAAAGVASRRACEDLIRAGRVVVNGNVILEPQHHVEPDKDNILVDGRRISISQDKVYYLLNKPTGYICSCERPAGGGRIVLDLFGKAPHRLFTVGRLDRDTSGLLLVTNDGEFANQIIHPSSRITKEYLVKCSNEVTDEALKHLSEGAFVEGAFVRPVSVKKVRRGSLRITLAEGRKHEVRILVMKAGLDLVDLQRIRLGSLTLGKMPSGTFRELTQAELRDLLEAAKQGRQRPFKQVPGVRSARPTAAKRPRTAHTEEGGKLWQHASMEQMGERRRPRCGAGSDDQPRTPRPRRNDGSATSAPRTRSRSGDGFERRERSSRSLSSDRRSADQPRQNWSAREDRGSGARRSERPTHVRSSGSFERRESGDRQDVRSDRKTDFPPRRDRQVKDDSGHHSRSRGSDEGFERRGRTEGYREPRGQRFASDRRRDAPGESRGGADRRDFRADRKTDFTPRRDRQVSGDSGHHQRSRGPDQGGERRGRTEGYRDPRGQRFTSDRRRDAPSERRDSKPRFDAAQRQSNRPRMQWEEVPIDACRSESTSLTPRRQKRLEFGKRFKDQGPKREMGQRRPVRDDSGRKPRALRPVLRD